MHASLHPPHVLRSIVRGLGVVGLLAVVLAVLGASTAWAQGRATLTPGDTILFESERVAMQERMARSVFRVVADVRPPKPYDQANVMRYDGAAFVIDHDGVAFLTTAAWLVNAERVALIDGDAELALEVERLDVRLDLALLRLPPDAGRSGDDGSYIPLPIADTTSVSSYTLLSPQTRYELLAQAVVLTQDNDEGGLYWTTTLAAANGYPIFAADGRLIAVQSRRSASHPDNRGLAVGWKVINDFLDPPEGLAHAREPDRVVEMRGTGGEQTETQTTRTHGARLQW